MTILRSLPSFIGAQASKLGAWVILRSLLSFYRCSGETSAKRLSTNGAQEARSVAILRSLLSFIGAQARPPHSA